MVASLGTSPLDIRDKAILLVFFGSGLRASELAALKLKDLDLDTGIVKVINGKGGKDGIVPLSSLSIEAPGALASGGRLPSPVSLTSIRAGPVPLK